MGWIGIDLNGTLAQSTKDESIGDPILPMITAVNNLLNNGIEIKIFTARQNISDIKTWCLYHFNQRLDVTSAKTKDTIALIDDRCIAVERNTGYIYQPISTHIQWVLDKCQNG